MYVLIGVRVFERRVVLVEMERGTDVVVPMKFKGLYSLFVGSNCTSDVSFGCVHDGTASLVTSAWLYICCREMWVLSHQN